MEDVERLLKGTVEELEKLLDARNVLGEAIERDGTTIIPMVSYGFGFGAGGGTSQKAAASSRSARSSSTRPARASKASKGPCPVSPKSSAKWLPTPWTGRPNARPSPPRRSRLRCRACSPS